MTQTTMNPFKESNPYGEFKITMPIKKAYEREDAEGGTHMYIQGLASGVGLDHHGERMAKSAIDAFAKAVEEGTYLPNGELSLIPLRSGHRKEWDDILGYVTKAEIDSDYNLWIEAELDETSSHARDLFAKLSRPVQPKKPLQLGFSVGGKIKKAGFEFDEATKGRVRVIEDVMLREISVVGSPAYPTAYVEALEKSVNWDEISEQVQESDMTKDTDVQNQSAEAQAENIKADDVVKADETASISEETEVVETEVIKSEEASAADPQAELKEQVEALSKSVTTLTENVNTLMTALNKASDQAAPDVVKSEEKVEETTEESVEKSLEDRVGEAVAAALTKFKTDNLDPLLTDMQAVKKSVEVIGGQELDKSVAIRNEKDEDDTFTKFTQDVEKTRDPIRSAVRLAYRGEE